MKPNLEKILKKNPQARPDPAFVNELQEKLRNQATSFQQAHRSKLYRWVTRCSTVAASVALLLFFLIPHNSDSFAAMQDVIRQSNYLSVQVEMKIYIPLTQTTIPLSKTQSWIARSQGIRSDINLFNKPLIQLWHPWDGDPLIIDHLHQMTLPIELPDEIDPRELLQFDPTTLIHQISLITGKPQLIEAPESQLAGYRINSSALKLPSDASVEVWIDRVSNRPTRINCTIPLPNGTKLLWVADHFAWDRQNMPAVLEPSVPESYQQKTPLKIPTPTIQAVARSLKCYAAHSKGRYPTSQTLPWQTAIQAFIKSTQSPQQLKPTKQQLVELADALAGGIYILRAREHGAEIDYHGNKIQAGDNNELLSIRHLDGRIESLDGKLNIKVMKP